MYVGLIMWLRCFSRLEYSNFSIWSGGSLVLLLMQFSLQDPMMWPMPYYMYRAGRISASVLQTLLVQLVRLARKVPVNPVIWFPCLLTSVHFQQLCSKQETSAVYSLPVKGPLRGDAKTFSFHVNAGSYWIPQRSRVLFSMKSLNCRSDKIDFHLWLCVEKLDDVLGTVT